MPKSAVYPTQAELLSAYRYIHETGELMNISTGSICGARRDPSENRYVYASTPWGLFLAHRLIWIMLHGTIPPGRQIDHVNGERWDNRLPNLRCVTPQQNQFNRRLSSKNRSGVKGVSWCSTRKVWIACVWKDGRAFHLGRFKCLNEATETVRAVRHKLHGEFRNNGNGTGSD